LYFMYTYGFFFRNKPYIYLHGDGSTFSGMYEMFLRWMFQVHGLWRSILSVREWLSPGKPHSKVEWPCLPC